MTRQLPNFSRLTPLVLSLFLNSCAASVETFTASPTHICSDKKVHLVWETVGSASLALTPPISAFPDGPIPSKGSATISPTESTIVTLSVDGFLRKVTSSRKEITVIQAKTESLTASTADPAVNPGCRDGKVWAIIRPKHFADDIRVNTIGLYPGDNHSYEIQHAGYVTIIAPGETSTAFVGTSLTGDWRLIATLRPSETCRDAPNNLVVNVLTECNPEALP